jgi:arylsulfatase A-like enzyme
VTPRPNFLLITSDQHRADCFGFAGRRVFTPHLDLLAARGTRFAACITPNVVCQPARASLLTGLLPLTHGVHDNGIDLDECIGERGLAGQLARAGYDTAFIGKAHFSTYHTYRPTGRPECVTSSQDYPPDWHGPYQGFAHVELILIGHNYWLPYRPPRGLHYEHWYYADGLGDLRNECYARRLPPEVSAPQTFHSGLPVAWHHSTWVADRTIEWVRAHGRERPFCLWASFPDPHHPFDAPVPWSRLHDPRDVDLPPHRERDLHRRPWWHRASVEGEPQSASPEMRRVRREYSRIGPQDDTRLRELISNYYGMVSLIDHNVGRIVKALADAGHGADTIVVFTSDHGDWLGDHGLILKGPMHYEGLLRVALLVSGPGVPAGKVVHEPVSTIDVAATLADYAGIDGAWARNSTSLRPLIEGNATRDFAFNEWYLLAGRTGVELNLRTVRTRDAKLTLELASGAGELYDLARDPHEMNNLFDDPRAARLRDDLTAMAMSRPSDALAPLPQQVGSA